MKEEKYLLSASSAAAAAAAAIVKNRKKQEKEEAAECYNCCNVVSRVREAGRHSIELFSIDSVETRMGVALTEMEVGLSLTART